MLEEMEIMWTQKQKELKKARLQQNLQKKVRAKDFVDQILLKCKTHDGPFTSPQDVKAFVNSDPDDLKACLRQEIQFQRVTHPNDAEARKDLYKVNKLSEEDMIENLTVLLDDSCVEEAVIFPTEDEIFEKLSSNTTLCNDDQMYQPNEPLAVFWDEGQTRSWYVGFFIDENDDGTFRIDHLTKHSNTNDTWARPNGRDDIQNTLAQQILPLKVQGDWDFTGRKPIYVLENAQEINTLFVEIAAVA